MLADKSILTTSWRELLEAHEIDAMPVTVEERFNTPNFCVLIEIEFSQDDHVTYLMHQGDSVQKTVNVLKAAYEEILNHKLDVLSVDQPRNRICLGLAC